MNPPATDPKPEKPRFPRALALDVARELVRILEPASERIIVAGSLRRRNETVGDVEILYIPKQRMATDGELFEQPKNLADVAIEDLLRRFVLAKRTNVKGSEMFGTKNKLLRHVLSGMPVDLFAATPQNWWNYVVCGPAALARTCWWPRGRKPVVTSGTLTATGSRGSQTMRSSRWRAKQPSSNLSACATRNRGCGARNPFMSKRTIGLEIPPWATEVTGQRRDPVTPQEWQDTVNLAEACLLLESSRAYGLTRGGPEIDVPRCEEIIAGAKCMGIVSQPEGIKTEVKAILRACAKGGLV